MQFIREPKNFEEENWAYLSIGYHNGKAVLKDEAGNLYYMECEEEAAPIGTMVSEGAFVKPLDELSKDERTEIIRIYHEEYRCSDGTEK